MKYPTRLAEAIVLNVDYLLENVERGKKFDYYGGYTKNNVPIIKQASRAAIHRQITHIRDMLLDLDREIAKSHKF